MSHVVTIQTKVHDPVAVAAACQRLNLPAPVQGTVHLYSGEATGLIVRLPGWQYPGGRRFPSLVDVRATGEWYERMLIGERNRFYGGHECGIAGFFGKTRCIPPDLAVS
jgi:hypothetical protein